jgi:hypothetical protein
VIIMTAAINQCGDTIEVTEQFYDFDGNAEDLTGSCTVKLYQADKSTVLITATATHTMTGTYQYLLTLPATEGIYYLEFSGTAPDGKATAHREAFIVKFSSST